MDGRSQPLGPKDAAAFQQALTLYEAKEYAKSLERVEEVLARRQGRVHGESLALKALLYHHLDKDTAEAEKLMAEGTTADSKSHVAWHMSGIFHKLRHEYPQAHKSYVQSYRIKRDNPNVHQDLAMTAAQQRDFETLVDVRRQLLGRTMSLRMSWTGLIAAQFLAGDYAGVEQTAALYEQIMTVERVNQNRKTGQAKVTEEIEESELLMLRNRAIRAQGQWERALEDLETIERRVRDKLAWAEANAEALAKLGRTDDAKRAYYDLIERNPEDLRYYVALESLVGDNVQLYDDLAKKYPKADLPVARPLELFSAGSPGYPGRVKSYLTVKLARKVPSTFMLVQPLYEDRSKLPVIVSVVEDLGLLSGPAEDPATVVFAARHYSFTHQHAKAVELLEKFITTTEKLDVDTEVDVQLAYARVLQRAGDFAKAASVLAKCAKLIPGDRFLNSAAAEAAFRANDVEAGYRLAYQFPIWGKHATTHEEAHKHILAVESVNVVVAMAEAHHRRLEHGLALKRATEALDLFNVYYREQYDFHFYGPRRGTLRSYLDVIAWEDTLFTHPMFKRALEVAVSEWVAQTRGELALNKDGSTPSSLASSSVSLDSASADPPATPNDKEGQAVEPEASESADGLKKEKSKPDLDPNGIIKLEADDGLQQAFEAYKHLENAKPTTASTWLIGFGILVAQKKYVLATQALKRAREFGASSSQVAAGALLARHTLEGDATAPPVIRGLQLKLLPTIATDGDVVNESYVDYADTYVTDIVEWVRIRRLIGELSGVEAKLIARLPDVIDVETVEAIYIELRRADLGADFAQAVKKQWPRASFV